MAVSTHAHRVSVDFTNMPKPRPRLRAEDLNELYARHVCDILSSFCAYADAVSLRTMTEIVPLPL